MYIEIPFNLNLKSAVAFVSYLLSLPDEKEYVFDFINLRWIEPFSLLYLSFSINHFVVMHPNARLEAKNYNNTDASNYAGHMGFFKAFRLDVGKKPGEALGNKNYLPIQIFDLDVWQEEAKLERKYVGEIIEKRSREFAQVLTRQSNGDLIDTLEFVLREIIRNVAEHSGAQQVGFCAQYWPNKCSV
ncbi:MAG: hypothetical protein PHZ02_15260, partial [Desulfocapsaceae bacterium]|nr:hypothetical protein [Desulfocapsaceae bacterium]